MSYLVNMVANGWHRRHASGSLSPQEGLAVFAWQEMQAEIMGHSLVCVWMDARGAGMLFAEPRECQLRRAGLASDVVVRMSVR